jgi:hypothetical protein
MTDMSVPGARERLKLGFSFQNLVVLQALFRVYVPNSGCASLMRLFIS